MRNILIITICVWVSILQGFSQSFSDKDVNKYVLEGSYYSNWGATIWRFDFEADSTFFFESKGHAGGLQSWGWYTIIGDTLTLNSNPADTAKSKFFLPCINDRFLVLGDTCIMDLHDDSGDTYCKITSRYKLDSKKNPSPGCSSLHPYHIPILKTRYTYERVCRIGFRRYEILQLSI